MAAPPGSTSPPHNPKQYNGYKAYWSDGAQLGPEQADAVSDEIAKADIFKGVKNDGYDSLVKSGMISVVGRDFDEKYIAAVTAQIVNPGAIPAVADELRIVYIPLHGVGYRIIMEKLKRV